MYVFKTPSSSDSDDIWYSLYDPTRNVLMWHECPHGDSTVIVWDSLKIV